MVGRTVARALLLAAPVVLHAQLPVTDAGAIAQLISQVRRQIQQVTMQTQQLQAQLNNMRKLGAYNVRQIAATLQQIDGLTQQGQAIWYSLQTIDAEFRRTFPGWQLSTTFLADMRVQQERTLATLRSAANAAMITAQQFQISKRALARTLRGRRSENIKTLQQTGAGSLAGARLDGTSRGHAAARLEGGAPAAELTR